MSVRFDAAADRLLRTTDLLDYNSPYTLMFWVYLVADQNAITIPAALFRDAGNVDDIRTLADGTTIGIRSRALGVGGTISGSVLALNTWYHLAMVRESATSLKLYVNGVLDATATQSISGRNAILRMELGAESSSNTGPMDGRVMGIKAWSVSKTAAEIANEMRTIKPKSTANLYGWWSAGIGQRSRDLSGYGRDFTEVGTLTDEADTPEIIWGSRYPLVLAEVIIPPVIIGTTGLLAQYDLNTALKAEFDRITALRAEFDLTVNLQASL